MAPAGPAPITATRRIRLPIASKQREPKDQGCGRYVNQDQMVVPFSSVYFIPRTSRSGLLTYVHDMLSKDRTGLDRMPSPAVPALQRESDTVMLPAKGRPVTPWQLTCQARQFGPRGAGKY